MRQSITLQLVQPSFFRILWGTLSLLFQKSERVTSIPQQIGSYTLLESPQTGSKANFYSGIYTNGKEKVFIKTWSGTQRNYHYYALVNEYLMSQILTRKQSQMQVPCLVIVPQVRECLSTSNTISLVYEYIDGKQLMHFSPETQAKILIEIRQALLSYTNALTNRERKFFITRSAWFYFISFLPVFLIFARYYPRHALRVLFATCMNISSIFSLFHEELVLSHRDLTPRNVFVTDTHIYLIDLELMALAPRSLEPVQMLISSDYVTLNDQLSGRFAKEANMFLFLRMLLIALIDRHSYPEYAQVYVEHLLRASRKV